MAWLMGWRKRGYGVLVRRLTTTKNMNPGEIKHVGEQEVARLENENADGMAERVSKGFSPIRTVNSLHRTRSIFKNQRRAIEAGVLPHVAQIRSQDRLPNQFTPSGIHGARLLRSSVLILSRIRVLMQQQLPTPPPLDPSTRP